MLTPQQQVNEDEAQRIRFGLNKAPVKSAETVNTPESPADRITKFSLGLNKAIDEGRKQRQDKTMDFMNGVVPPGALPASSFAQVLKSFNSSSAPLEASLVEGAMDFATQQEKIKEDTKNNIRDLALKVGENGGKQETVDAITALIESGDIDSALKIGATALSKGNEDIRQVGSNLVKVDKDGNVTVIYSAPKSESDGWTPTQIRAQEEEAAKATYEDRLRAEVGTDGKTNPFAYNQLYKEIVVDGGIPEAEFFKDFPPSKWLRYEDPSIDPHIKVYMTQPPKEKAATTEKVDPMSDEYLLGL